MDKKNTTIGILLLLGAIASFYFSSKFAAPPSPPKPGAPTTSASSPAAAPAGTRADLPKANHPEPVEGPATAPVSSRSVASTPAEYEMLANEFLEVRFTNHGGAIDRIALKKHAAVQGRPELYTLNAAQAAPALSLADFPGADRFTAYTLVSRSSTEIVYRAIADDLEVTRRYSLVKTAKLDDYQIRHETTFRNLGDKLLPLPRLSLNLGTATPLNDADKGLYLNAGFYDGKDATFVGRGDLEGGGLLAGVGLKDGTPPPFIEKPAAFVWASVKNQFFAMILTPDQPGTGVRTERVLLDPKADPLNRQAYGITSYARFELKPLAAGASETLAASYFAGPKEYKRLSNADIFDHNEAKVLQFDTYFFNRMFFSGFFAPLLLTIMTWVHSLVGNWGWAIVITTLILKIVFLPFTLAASRSAKRMAKLNPLMQAMREKFKDNPQKIQSETLRLFKENKVNPLGGCIPILITIPFFVGFFAMLQSACDLRFASFLWVADLSAQDTVMHLFGLPLNIMPLLMGATMIIQMRLTPTPTTDNAQATMMKIMPWMFTLFCYTFASGLALYSTINGLFTIVQQLVINRMPEPELPAVAAAAGGKSGPGGMKNVTPPKKKK